MSSYAKQVKSERDHSSDRCVSRQCRAGILGSQKKTKEVSWKGPKHQEETLDDVNIESEGERDDLKEVTNCIHFYIWFYF